MSNPLHTLRTGIFIQVLKLIAVVIVILALFRWGAQAIDARDDMLFWLGLSCYIGALAALIFGSVFIADGVHKLIQKMESSK